MNWNTFRTEYVKKHGRTNRDTLSRAYQQSKKSPRRRSPPNSPRYTPSRYTTRMYERQYANKNTTGKLTQKDFDNDAKNLPQLVVVLYADWCAHCQAMKERLGKKMKNTQTIKFIEANKLDDAVTDYFPRILYYQDGKKQKDLSVDDLYNHLGV